MIYKSKGGGHRQRKIRAMLAEHRQPLKVWWIAEQLETDYRAVFKSLQGLRRRGVVRKVGPRYRCSYALAVSA